MDEKELQKIKYISKSFLFKGKLTQISSHGSGLINDTYKLAFKEKNNTYNYILQRVNTDIFERPEHTCQNIRIVSEKLAQKSYPKSYLQLVTTLPKNATYYKEKDEFWRAFKFIENTTTYDATPTVEAAYEAAKAFAEFDYYLSDLPASKIQPAIPNFHDFGQRVVDFKKVLKQNIKDRKKYIKKEIDTINSYMPIYKDFRSLKLPTRIVHGDPKINNLLFHRNLYIVKSVIDYDTLIPSNYLIELGDMIRSMSCTRSEEEQNLDIVELDKYKFQAISEGFTEELTPILSDVEKNNFVLAAKVVILTQALRFLTDFLIGDQYYKIRYPQHNLLRVNNQLVLLLDLTKKNKTLTIMK